MGVRGLEGSYRVGGELGGARGLEGWSGVSGLGGG